ncbi:MAG: hypothetical protein LBP63_01970 [Prevotellaceae bacterium]|nr:hypothetical protein [Prevotellaceae bacterium]
MKKLEMLPLSAEQKKRIAAFATMYKKNAHIIIDIVAFNDNRLIVRAEQKSLVNGKQLSKKELTERVREMFNGEIPAEWKLTVSAVDFNRKDIDAISAEWIRSKMEHLSLKNKTITTHTGIDKCTVSSILNGEKELTKWHKVAFYYFFKYYEINSFV